MGHKRSKRRYALAVYEVSHTESDFSPVYMYDGAERESFPSEPRVYRLSVYGNQNNANKTSSVGRVAVHCNQVDSATDEEEDPLSRFSPPHRQCLSVCWTWPSKRLRFPVRRTALAGETSVGYLSPPRPRMGKLLGPTLGKEIRFSWSHEMDFARMGCNFRIMLRCV